MPDAEYIEINIARAAQAEPDSFIIVKYRFEISHG
jgi:hypothetical protein